MNTTLVILTGFIVRLILPLAVTALIVYLLHKLDVRWQAEAESERARLVKDKEEIPCWKDAGLPVSEIKTYVAQKGQSCWQARRLSNGYMREACLDCELFLSAPIPTPKHSHIHL